MLGAIKRVISGENMEEDEPQQAVQQRRPRYNESPPISEMPSTNTFAVVENDDDDDDAMDAEISNDNDNRQVNDDDDNSTMGSSISDVSVGNKEGKYQNSSSENLLFHGNGSDHPMVIIDKTSGVEDKPPPGPRNTAMVSSIPKPTNSSLARSDSRNSSDSYSSYGRQSSQNSSRDWGWFEETEHGGGAAISHTSNTKRTQLSGNSKEEWLLQRQLQQAASSSNAGGGTVLDGSNDPSLGDWSTFPSSMSWKKKGKQSRKKSKSAGTSLLPNLALTASDDMLMDETQQVLLDPPTDLESEARAMAVTAPNYVLEESLSSQLLWKDTAGNRPPQPVEERAFFEKMWAQNFARSQVEYQMPVDVLTATTPISMSPFADGNFDSAGGKELSNYNLTSPADGGMHAGGVSGPGHQQDVAEATLVSRLNDPARGGHSVVSSAPGQHQLLGHEVVNRKIKGSKSDEDMTVLIKGDNVFGTTVSKSFARPSVNGGPIAGVDTVNISIASYRVVESRKHGKYAQFLVIYREGSIRDTIGVWKRYSDFQRLSEKVTKAHEGCAAVIANMSPLAVTEEHDVEHLPNAITSWRLLKKRQRWYRCLDAGYLSLKVFLLERFLHDILFESSSPDLLREFVNGE